MNKKCRLIWDDSTPCADRRPTTPEDLEDDIHVVDYESEEDLLNELLELSGYDPEDIELDETLTPEELIKKVIRLFDDVGDGSPNILYVSIGGKEISGSLPYDSLSNIDLEKATREEVIETLKREFEDEDEDSDEDDEEINYSYVVYELDEEGDEVDSLESFDTLEEAITFAEKQPFPTHIVYVPDQDPDDYGYPETPDDYEAYEVVWSSKDDSDEDDEDNDEEDADTDDHLCQDCGTELAKDGRCYNKDCDAYDPFSQYFDDDEKDYDSN